MDELKLLVELHKNENRQGPGSSLETKKALDLININKNNFLKIADIGCGTGAQTFVIAENTNSEIFAVDLFPEFLEILNSKSQELGYKNRIFTKNQSMDNLDFKNEELDIILSEGAIYNIGFENGLKIWNKFLKKSGYLAVTEISWITNERPKEINDYWNSIYPEIDTISNKIKIIEKNNYSPIAHFVLPEYCWLENYYNPLKEKFENFLNNNNSEMALNIVEQEKEEIRMYEKYKDYYSYVFYIAKKL